MTTKDLERSESLDKAHDEIVVCEEKMQPAKDGQDYSGAARKTDPAEIALVKKLDYRIMPTLWAMYFLNYVSVIMPQQSCTPTD